MTSAGDVNPDNIVIQVKSEQSDRSAGQHPEYQVDMKRYQSGGGSQGISPAHGSGTPNQHSSNKFSKKTNEPLYKVWTGEQVFFLDGKLQLGINIWQPMITFSIINVLQSCLLANTIMDLVKNKDGYFAFFIFGLVLQIVASVFLWVTAAKDPATIPSRVST